MTVARPDSLHFELIAPGAARLGTPVAITLRLTNVSDRPVEAHFLGRTIAFDIVVSREDGTVVWRRLDGATVPGILQIRTLQPRETMAWRDVWQPVERGTYVIRGELPSDASEPRRSSDARIHIE